MKLKLCALENQDIFMSRDFIKSSLILLCRAYNVKSSSLNKMKKEEIINNLVQTIKSSNSMPNPGILDGSVSESNGKGKGKGKNKSKSEKVYCKVCGKLYNKKESWIQCTSCNGWVHKDCGEFTEDEWTLVSMDEDMPWECPVCAR